MLNYERFLEHNDRVAGARGTPPYADRSKGQPSLDLAREPRVKHRGVRASKQMWVAVEQDQPQVLRVLITKRGADANQVDGAGRSALWHCAWRGLSGAIDVLVACGADPDARDGDGDSPLAAAARRGRPHIVEELLGHGASARTRNDDGVTALWHAANYGHVDAARLLAPRSDLEAKDSHGRTALFAACAAERDTAAAVLLDARADPRAADDKGRTCLHVACAKGASAIVDSILHHHGRSLGDLVDAEDKFGRTPLWTAAMAGCHDAAAALLARGARKDFPAFSGRTPQEIADMYGHYDLGKFIANYVKPATPRPPEPSPAPAPAPAATERPRSAGEAVVSAKPSLGLPELDVARAKAGVRVFEALPAP